VPVAATVAWGAGRQVLASYDAVGLPYEEWGERRGGPAGSALRAGGRGF
jgi:hypothetical protein